MYLKTSPKVILDSILLSNQDYLAVFGDIQTFEKFFRDFLSSHKHRLEERIYEEKYRGYKVEMEMKLMMQGKEFHLIRIAITVDG